MLAEMIGLGTIGFLIMAIIIFLLLKNVTIPSIAFIVVPVVFCFLAGFGVSDLSTFIKKGVAGVYQMAALFIFSIMFFGLMSDVGMFDRIINKLAKKAGGNVILVCLLTTTIAIIAHLDGSGASTFLITIPAMLPVFARLRMRKTSLMLIATSAMGVMNLLPWGGPTMRAASVINVDAAELWHTFIPVQIFGLVLAYIVSYLVGLGEVRRGAGVDSTLPADPDLEGVEAKPEGVVSELARPNLFWFNVALTLAVLAVLTFVKLPAYFPFMCGSAVALLVNYPGAKNQENRVRSHSKGAIMMASTILAAGVLLGVLEQSGIMDDMARVLMSVIPESMGPHVAIIIGILSAPLALVFCTDSYYFGVMPIVVSVASKYGVNPRDVAITMIVCRNLACFISPVVPATFLGTGLARVDIKDHIKRSFFWVWGMSLAMLVFGIVIGIIKF